MPIERSGLIKFSGNDAIIVGPDMQLGQQAPEFTAQAMDWTFVKAIESTQGKVRIIGSLPSLNTSVCDRETRRFNEAAANLGDDIVIIMVSMDLPFTLRNWCAAAGIDRVITLSDHLEPDFGVKYGVLLKDQRIFRRAIFVINPSGQVVYADYMAAIGDEPKYEEVLAAAEAALAIATK